MFSLSHDNMFAIPLSVGSLMINKNLSIPLMDNSSGIIDRTELLLLILQGLLQTLDLSFLW